MYKMKLFLAGILVFLVCFQMTAIARENEEQGRKLKVLVVTGCEYEGHPWHQTAPHVGKILNNCPEIEAKVEPNFNVLCTDEIFNYDVMFFNFKNYDPLADDELAIANIEKFVRQGGGIVILHFGIGIFENHKDRVEKIIGPVYDPSLPPHDPYREFEVKIMDLKHPITKSMNNFTISDELYTCLGASSEPIEILAVGDSQVVKKAESLAHLHKYGQGYVFTTTLGHNLKSFESEGFVTLLRNAVLWLGHREVPAEPAQVLPPAPPLPK